MLESPLIFEWTSLTSGKRYKMMAVKDQIDEFTKYRAVNLETGRMDEDMYDSIDEMLLDFKYVKIIKTEGERE